MTTADHKRSFRGYCSMGTISAWCDGRRLLYSVKGTNRDAADTGGRRTYDCGVMTKASLWNGLSFLNPYRVRSESSKASPLFSRKCWNSWSGYGSPSNRPGLSRESTKGLVRASRPGVALLCSSPRLRVTSQSRPQSGLWLKPSDHNSRLASTSPPTHSTRIKFFWQG